jgi:hypothetical protein
MTLEIQKAKMGAGPLFCGKMSPIILARRVIRHKPMLTSALMWMSEELNRYISEIQEVPWFYNERSVLGFFISGLIRRGDAIVLQEFSCYKGKHKTSKKNLGRADLYFKFNDIDYLVEAKWCYTSINTRTGFDTAEEWARAALVQANSYAKDAKVHKRNVFSLCFEAIYCAEKNYKNYSKNINKWKITEVKELCGLDYYSLIEVPAAVPKKSYRYENDLYPALAIYGLFNR